MAKIDDRISSIEETLDKVILENYENSQEIKKLNQKVDDHLKGVN